MLLVHWNHYNNVRGVASRCISVVLCTLFFGKVGQDELEACLTLSPYPQHPNMWCTVHTLACTQINSSMDQQCELNRHVNPRYLKESDRKGHCKNMFLMSNTICWNHGFVLYSINNIKLLTFLNCPYGSYVYLVVNIECGTTWQVIHY